MGKSDQERKAEEMYNDGNSKQYRDSMVNTMSSDANRAYEGAISGVEQKFSSAKESLRKSTATNLQGVSKQMGEMLASLGIAPGHDTANAWIASQAPIIAQGEQSLAQLLGQEGSIVGGLRGNQADAIRQILQQVMQSQDRMKEVGLSGMKDSTEFGDWFATALQAGQLGLGFATGGSTIPLSELLVKTDE